MGDGVGISLVLVNYVSTASIAIAAPALAHPPARRRHRSGPRRLLSAEVEKEGERK
jgi:hypothetical protein